PNSASALTPAASPRDEAESPGGFSVDPKRLIGGLKLRRHWLVLGVIAGLGLGLAYGIFRAKARYEVSLQLIKRDTPTAFQIGTDGNPYRPREFTAQDLETAAVSRTVLEAVAAHSKPAVTADLLKYCVKAEEEKKTDFITLTLSGYLSPQATVDLVNQWAKAVVDFPKDVEASESREIREALEEQLQRNQDELNRLDEQSLQAPRSEVQLDTYLKSQGDFEMKLDSTTIDIESLDSEIDTLRNELIRQSPLADTLRQAQADLEQYRARYTEKNPLVAEKEEKIASIQQEMKQETKAAQSDLSKYAGTEVGNHLYMRIVELENQREALKRQNEGLVKLRERSQSATNGDFGLTGIDQRKQTLQTAQVLLLNRLQEMHLFEENAQEMYLILQPAMVGQVTLHGKPLKVAVFSIAGTMLGAGFAVMLAALAELLDSRLRTGGEAGRMLGAPIFGSIPRGCSASGRKEIGPRMWLRWSRECEHDGTARVIWSPVSEREEEAFWSMMLVEARRFIPSLLIIDCACAPSPALAELPQPGAGTDAPAIAAERWNIEAFSHAQMRDACATIEKHRAAGREVWLRLEGLIQEPASSLARATRARPLLLVAMDRESTRYWNEQVDLLRDSVGDICGAVLVNQAPVFVS
ncbi:MAG TPA: hypothetical protein VHY22_13100, partial [Chthoniobacteraceae bacterium]|nr:hypothetical protein [Chthoniobacteraceae bacterium]